MFIKLLRSYPKLEDGKQKMDSKGDPIIVFVYKVTGTKSDLEKYEQIQSVGDHTCKDDKTGDYLWFTTRPVGLKGVLMISTNDKIYADSTATDLAGAMLKQYPGKLGEMLAKEILGTGHVLESEPELVKDNKID